MPQNRAYWRGKTATWKCGGRRSSVASITPSASSATSVERRKRRHFAFDGLRARFPRFSIVFLALLATLTLVAAPFLLAKGQF